MLLEEGVCYDQCSLLAKLLLAFALLHFYSKAKLVCYSRYLLTSYFCIPVPYNEKDIFFWVLVLKGLVGLYRTIQLQLLQHSWLLNPSGIDLDYCDTEWFAVEINRDHSVFLEIATKYCNSDSFVDYEGYSISSKAFLTTVVDVMVI